MQYYAPPRNYEPNTFAERNHQLNFAKNNSLNNLSGKFLIFVFRNASFPSFKCFNSRIEVLICFCFFFKEKRDLSKGKLTIKQLLNDAWLTDTEINLFLDLLRKEFKNVNGLEDPLMIKYFKNNKKTEDFVRVMISNDNHWVCVAGGLYNGQEDVCLFDSSPRASIDHVLGQNIANVVTDRIKSKRFIRIRLLNTQKQQACFCGYFALANATALCYGLDPERILFNENEIRKHFIDCVYNGKKLSMFPHTQTFERKDHRMLTYHL